MKMYKVPLKLLKKIEKHLDNDVQRLEVKAMVTPSPIVKKLTKKAKKLLKEVQSYTNPK